MRLISLTANQESFHKVEFRQKGITLIVGAQSDASKADKGKTYNGVGKSLLLVLIHFCLGSKKNNEFRTKLPGWQFILHFEHDGKAHRVSRSTDSQDVVSLDGEELTNTKYCDFMRKLVFPLPKPLKFLTFRGLIPRFARSGKESYNTFDVVSKKATDYQNLIQNSYLLGLNLDLVSKKFELRKDQESVDTLRKNLNKDAIFREFFTDDKNADIELADLESRITKLKANQAAFNVAEDYHERQQEANVATRQLQELRNELVVVRNAIAEIDRSLEISPDIAPDTIAQIFAEANAALPERVVKRVEEVATFHRELIANRVKRLTSERSSLEHRMDRIEKDIAQANQRADELRRFLGTHGALDELIAMSESLRELEVKAHKLRDYQALLAKYSDRAQELTSQMSRQTIRATKYIKDAKPLLDSNMERFRSLSQRFYDKRPGGLTVKNNEGDNQQRFDIDAQIEDDAAAGINDVKIFCYDMTVLTQRHNHLMEFLFHDSLLFSDIDVRQRATIFKIAHEVTTGGDFQYIATMNEDQISAMEDQFTDKEFKQCITDATVLKLTDKNSAAKLLGIEVDMHY